MDEKALVDSWPEDNLSSLLCSSCAHNGQLSLPLARALDTHLGPRWGVKLGERNPYKHPGSKFQHNSASYRKWSKHFEMLFHSILIAEQSDPSETSIYFLAGDSHYAKGLLTNSWDQADYSTINSQERNRREQCLPTIARLQNTDCAGWNRRLRKIVLLLPTLSQTEKSAVTKQWHYLLVLKSNIFHGSKYTGTKSKITAEDTMRVEATWQRWQYKNSSWFTLQA